MNTTRIFDKAATTALLLAMIGGAGALAGGCAYGGVASTPDGTVIIARNGLFGAVRKIYVCKVTSGTLACVENPSAP